MKKSLVALAALAVSGAAMAQATIYGRTDIGYGVKGTQMGTGGTGVKQLGVMDGGNAGSRIGFRGTEDLGGGMKAHFVTEQGISPTNPALFGVRTGTIGIQYDGYAAASGNDRGSAGGYTQGTNRQTYVGVEGGFGTIRVGYQYTSAYEISSLSGFTNTSEGVAGGSIAHLWGTGVAGGTRANMINYISPKLAGAWTVGLQMGSAGGRENTEFVGVTNTANGRLIDKQARTSLHIDYNAGPLRAAFGYTTFDGNLGGALANNAVGALGAVNTVTNTFSVLGALTAAAVPEPARAPLSPTSDNVSYVRFRPYSFPACFPQQNRPAPLLHMLHRQHMLAAAGVAAVSHINALAAVIGRRPDSVAAVLAGERRAAGRMAGERASVLRPAAQIVAAL